MNHFFDVGANTGQTFDKFLLKTNDYDGWKIWCFEPSPRNMNGLVETARRVTAWPEKGVHDFDVVVCPFGLWDKAGSFSFYEKSDALDPWGKENGEGDSFKENWITNNKSGYKINAVTVPILQFIQDNTQEGDRIVIKLDCEGAEYKILENLLVLGPDVINRIDKIYIEWHTTDEEHKKPSLIEAMKEVKISLIDWPF
jgi:FkbM family methyltransferase